MNVGNSGRERFPDDMRVDVGKRRLCRGGDAEVKSWVVVSVRLIDLARRGLRYITAAVPLSRIYATASACPVLPCRRASLAGVGVSHDAWWSQACDFSLNDSALPPMQMYFRSRGVTDQPEQLSMQVPPV